MSAAPLDAAALRAALARWGAALEAAAPELNALDGQLGDGDLGTTLQRCAANVRALLEAGAPAGETPGSLFKACAQACAKASGSSFGTLLAVAFLSAAKQLGEAGAIERADLPRLLEDVAAALSARGGAKPGDKTMLDALLAVAGALREPGDDPAAAARGAAAQAVADFSGRPNRIGRARMFAERSIGLARPRHGGRAAHGRGALETTADTTPCSTRSSPAAWRWAPSTRSSPSATPSCGTRWPSSTSPPASSSPSRPTSSWPPSSLL
ncbi:MAG: DAK2 domain-containing protein [Rubrivivax sp.]